MNRSY